MQQQQKEQLTRDSNRNNNAMNGMDLEQSHLRTAQAMSSEIRLGYFHTIQLAYKTWNFDHSVIAEHAQETDSNGKGKQINQQAQKIGEEYQTIYLPQVLLVGNIVKLQDFHFKKQETKTDAVYMMAQFKSTYDNGAVKHFLFRKIDYKLHFVKHFNRMMKNKNEKYLFTNLQPIYYSKNILDNQYSTTNLYFLLQPTSYLIHVTQQYYNVHLKPIQKIYDQDFRFANIKLSKIYSVDELDKNCKDGFMISQIKQRFEARQKQNITIVGLIHIIDKSQYDKAFRGKKQITMMVTQVLYRYDKSRHLSQPKQSEQQSSLKCEEIGYCKVIVRYTQSQEEYVEQLFLNNHVYVIADPEIVVTDSANIIYVLNIQKNNSKNHCIFRVSTEPCQGINFSSREIMHKLYSNFSLVQLEDALGIRLQTTKIQTFLEKSINRNIVKLRLGFLQAQIIYGSIRCSKCGFQIKKDIDFDDDPNNFDQGQQNSLQMKKSFCRRNHKQSHGLHFWGTVRAADDSGSCLVSMQHKELMKYLQLHQYYDDIQNFIRHQGRGMVIMTSNKDKSKSGEDDPLFRIKNRIRKRYVQKYVIGFAKTELDKTFRQGLSQEQQLDYQVSFQNTKKFLTQKKIFPNGVIQKKSEELLLLPFIKTLEVQDSQW